MRRTVGELKGSRDTVSTLERVSMEGRSPGEQRSDSKSLMRKVYSRAEVDICCGIPAREKYRVPFVSRLGTLRDGFLLPLTTGRQRLLLRKP